MGRHTQCLVWSLTVGCLLLNTHSSAHQEQTVWTRSQLSMILAFSKHEGNFLFSPAHTLSHKHRTHGMERRLQGPPEVTTPWSNTSSPSSHVSELTSIIDIFLGRVNNNPRRANTDGQASKGETIPGFLASWEARGEPELKAVLRGGESEARQLKTSSRQEPVLCQKASHCWSEWKETGADLQQTQTCLWVRVHHAKSDNSTAQTSLELGLLWF